jgi:uncharacterized membrane protein (DUF485 family)
VYICCHDDFDLNEKYNNDADMKEVQRQKTSGTIETLIRLLVFYLSYLLITSYRFSTDTIGTYG